MQVKTLNTLKKKNMKYAYLQIQHIDSALKKALDDSSTTNNNFIVFELFKINNMPKNKTSSLKTKLKQLISFTFCIILNSYYF